MMAGDFSISKNAYNRFDVENTEEEAEYIKNGKPLKGINGFHGFWGNLIGLFLEKIFHKTVAVEGRDGKYYFNCKSFAKWLKRIDPEKYGDVKNNELNAHSRNWVHVALNDIVNLRKLNKVLEDEKKDAEIKNEPVNSEVIVQEPPAGPKDLRKLNKDLEDEKKNEEIKNEPVNPEVIVQEPPAGPKEKKTFQEYFNGPNTESLILEKLKNDEINNKYDLDAKGNTIVHLAVEKGYVSILTYAVEILELDVNAINRANLTPLHLAAKNNQKNAAIELIRLGAKNNKNKNDLSPFDLAIENQHLELAEEIRNRAPKGKNEFVEVLKQEHEQPIHLKDLFDQSTKQEDILKKVESDEININHRDEKGNTLLHYAVEKGYINVIQCAVETKKMDINITNDDGITPLHLAAKHPNRRVTASALIEMGADVCKKNNDGKLPEELAYEGNNVALARAISEKRLGIENNPTK